MNDLRQRCACDMGLLGTSTIRLSNHRALPVASTEKPDVVRRNRDGIPRKPGRASVVSGDIVTTDIFRYITTSLLF